MILQTERKKEKNKNESHNYASENLIMLII